MKAIAFSIMLMIALALSAEECAPEFAAAIEEALYTNQDASEAVAAVEAQWTTPSLYEQAQLLYYKGYLALRAKETKSAKAYYDQAMNLLDGAKSYATDSDSNRLKDDILSQLMLINDFFFQTRNGMTLEALPRRALELNPANDRAKISLAMFFNFAPFFVGGNPKRGRELLGAAAHSESKVIRFAALAWLGHAYKIAGDKISAQEAFDQAEAIYPGSLWLKEVEQRRK